MRTIHFYLSYTEVYREDSKHVYIINTTKYHHTLTYALLSYITITGTLVYISFLYITMCLPYIFYSLSTFKFSYYLLLLVPLTVYTDHTCFS